MRTITNNITGWGSMPYPSFYSKKGRKIICFTIKSYLQTKKQPLATQGAVILFN